MIEQPQSPSKKEEAEVAQSQMLKAIDTSKEFILTTKLDKGELSIDMRHYDLEGPNVSFFELSLKNDTLSNDILKVFDSVEELFEKCFAKKQNYKMQANGRITIRYKIELETEKMGKEIVLHLLPL